MRDDFTKKTIETLGKRVGMRCSNPKCRQLTSGPRGTQEQSVNIGVAAHIYAASPMGPRYKTDMTKDARRSIRNGIWLCQNCAKLIDNDTVRYSSALLIEWKMIAETSALRELESNSSDVYLTEERGHVNYYKNKTNDTDVLNSKKLLVIDDDKFFLDDLCFFLNDAGFDVLPANGFEDAVSVLSGKSDQVDLVLLDFMMLRPSNSRLCDYINKNEETGVGIARYIIKHHPHIRIIGLTASSRKLECITWFIKHCAGFFYKPFDEIALEKLIDFVKQIRGAIINSTSGIEFQEARKPPIPTK